MSEPTYDLVVNVSLTEDRLRQWAAFPDVEYIKGLACARLAEIDAERAADAAVKKRRVWTFGRMVDGNWHPSPMVLASDLRPGDVVEGRTVEWTEPDADGSTRVRWKESGFVAYYRLGLLVLLDSEATSAPTAGGAS